MTLDAPESFAKALRKHMSRLGLSVSDLVVLLGVTESTIYKWLRGFTPRPLTRQAVLYRLEQTRDYRYSAKEIESALRAYRH